MAWNGTYAQDGAKSILNNTGTSELDSAIKGISSTIQDNATNLATALVASNQANQGMSQLSSFFNDMHEVDLAKQKVEEEKNSLDLMVQQQQEKEQQLRSILNNAKDNAQQQVTNEMVNNATGGQDLPTLTQEIDKYIDNYHTAQSASGTQSTKQIIDPVTNKSSTVNLGSSDSSLKGISKDVIKDFILHRDKALAAYKSGALTLGQYANIESMAMKEGISDAVKLEAEGKTIKEMVDKGFRTPEMYRREAQILKESNPFYFRNDSINDISLALSQGQDLTTGRFDGQKYISQEKSDLNRAMDVYGNSNIGNTVNANANEKNTNTTNTNSTTTKPTIPSKPSVSATTNTNIQKPENPIQKIEDKQPVDANGNFKTVDGQKDYLNADSNQYSAAADLNNSIHKQGKSVVSGNLDASTKSYTIGNTDFDTMSYGSDKSKSIAKTVSENGTIKESRKIFGEILKYKHAEVIDENGNLNSRLLKSVNRMDSNDIQNAIDLLQLQEESFSEDLANARPNSEEYNTINNAINNVSNTRQNMEHLLNIKNSQSVKDKYDQSTNNVNYAFEVANMSPEEINRYRNQMQSYIAQPNLDPKERTKAEAELNAFNNAVNNGPFIIENAVVGGNPINNFDNDKVLNNPLAKINRSLFVSVTGQHITINGKTFPVESSGSIIGDSIDGALGEVLDEKSLAFLKAELAKDKDYTKAVAEFEQILGTQEGLDRISRTRLFKSYEQMTSRIQAIINNKIAKIHDDGIGTIKTRNNKTAETLNDSNFRDILEEKFTFVTEQDSNGAIKFRNIKANDYKDFLQQQYEHKNKGKQLEVNSLDQAIFNTVNQ